MAPTKHYCCAKNKVFVQSINTMTQYWFVIIWDNVI